MKSTLTEGALAYIDSFGGLVPCKVVGIGEPARTVAVKVTATRNGYKLGEVVTIGQCHIVPRNHVRHLHSRPTIFGSWNVDRGMDIAR